MDLERWLSEHDLGKYAPVFAEHEVELGDLTELTGDDLKEMGLPVGPRRRALKAISQLEATEIAPAVDETRRSLIVAGGAERRQMTVVFCDLVGSTALSGRLDPEDLREVMGRYQDAVTEVFSSHGGYVAKYLGDGVLVYFGWPNASEDQAVRSLEASLEVVSAVAELAVEPLGDEVLSSRIGIASGSVVVGDLSGERDAIVGETPNLAARLEGVAEPGEVVVDESTARLVEHDFELTNAEHRDLKGIERPVAVSRVLARRQVTTRFEATHQKGELDILVGRQDELSFLRKSWELAASGQGQFVLIGGEAGIGKSRLIHELVESVSGVEFELFRFQCAPAHTASMLFPFIQQIDRRAQLSLARDDGERLTRLENLVSGWRDKPDETVPLVAELLKIPLGSRYESLELTPEKRKSRVLKSLISQILSAAERRPVVVIVEDLHWVDPTSLDLVKRIATDLAHRRILMLGSHRSGWPTGLVPGDHVRPLTLDRLGTTDVIELTRAIAGDEISDQVLRDVAERTDGNPLYVEEFTRAVIGGLAVAKGHRVPVSLMSSLVARLDQLGDAKPVAQAASIIGREFSRDLLAEVVDAPPPVVDSALRHIVAAGLVRRVNRDRETEFSFKHALVRDAAYESMLRQDRRRLHRRIADRLAEESNAGGPVEPEIVAQHYWEAEDWERSILNWRRAGASAVANAAFEEASSHLDRALVALTRLPDSPGATHTEMEILLDLAPATMSVRGYASEEPKQLYDRAYELARDVGDENDRFTALWGGYFNTEMRAQWNESGENIEQLLALDTTELRADLPIQIDHAAMAYSNATGRFARCVVHAQRIADRYDPELHESHKFLFGAHDPCVCAFNQLAFAQVMLGYPDMAIDSMRRSQGLAGTLDHPPSRAHSKWYSGMTLHGLELLDEARRVVDDAIEYCTEQRVRPLLKTLEFYQLAMLPDREAAYVGLRARVDPMREHNRTGLFVPRLVNLCAGLAVEMGDVESALIALEYSQRASDATGDFSDMGETHHLRGQALRLSGTANREAAMSAFRGGIAISEESDARFPQLRNAVGLAELLRDAGDQTTAREVLEPRYAWFTEGHDMPLLQRAKQLLTELSSG